VLACRVSPK
jgi:phospholipid-transporting ATPase